MPSGFMKIQGWYLCNGQSLTTVKAGSVGAKFKLWVKGDNGDPSNPKPAYGAELEASGAVAVSDVAGTISLPNFYKLPNGGGVGRFIRAAASGNSGALEEDAVGRHKHSYHDTNWNGGGLRMGSASTMRGPGTATLETLDTRPDSNETRPINIQMYPYIYLGLDESQP